MLNRDDQSFSFMFAPSSLRDPVLGQSVIAGTNENRESLTEEPRAKFLQPIVSLRIDDACVVQILGTESSFLAQSCYSGSN